MTKKSKRSNIILPDTEIVLGALNDDKKSIERLLDFYDGYIMASAVKSAYSAEGQKIGYYIDEDLAQEIRMSVVKCLPNLRKTVNNIIDKKRKSILIVVANVAESQSDSE